ncbi:MAG: DUF2911 domain-containing protein [Chitinophagaceae bacterium]|nr:DUF2911 domain-containing protein [Chitinophagaceae bacterium]
MKKFLGLVPLFIAVFTISACAQDKSKRPSPPMSSEFKVGSANVTINYGAPSVKGREIWGKLVPYGQVWRTGANEATTFETDADIKVEGQTLPKGKYGLFTIPGENEWVIIFNKKAQQWGAYDYKEGDDVLRVKVKPAAGDMQEQLKIEGKGDAVSIAWEKVKVAFKVAQ